MVVSWNFHPLQQRTNWLLLSSISIQRLHFHLMTGMKKSSEGVSSVLSSVSLYAHPLTPHTLTPCLIRVLIEQGKTHHPVNAPSLLSQVSDNFQINSAIFHLTLSRPRAELSQSLNPAPAFKAVNPGLGQSTSVCLPPTLFGKWIVLKV